MRDLNMHMASAHGNGIGLQFFYYYVQNVLVKNFLKPDMGLFFPYLWKCVFFVALTSSPSLEHWIHLVLMNL